MRLNTCYHNLKIEQRGVIMGLAAEGQTLEHIANRCGVSTSTVSRELKRQFSEEVTPLEWREKYSTISAQKRYVKVRENCGPESKLPEDVRKRVERGLEKGFSPEQIANTDVREVSHVSIYSWLYKGFLKGGNRVYLRHRGKKRINRKDGQDK